MPTPTRLPKLLLASALTFAIHSTLHAATDIETGTPGINGTNGTSDAAPGTNGTNGGDAIATITSSDANNTVTATGGLGGNGGNGAATSSSPQAGDAGNGANGGNATASATLNPTGDITLTIIAQGGKGGDAGVPGPAGTTSSAGNPGTPGNGGNATVSLLSITNTSSANITVDVTVIGGSGGNQTIAGAPLSAGGNAILNPISASSDSGDITLSVGQQTGNAGGSISDGIAFDSNLNNIISASTTGNITLFQTAGAGLGAIGTGNASSTLTSTNLGAASITGTVTSWSGGNGLVSTASINLTGQNNVSARAHSIAYFGNGPANAIASGLSNISATAESDGIGNPVFENANSTFSATDSATAYGSNNVFSTYNAYASANSNATLQTQIVQAFAAPTITPSISQTGSLARFPAFHISNAGGLVDDQIVHTNFIVQSSQYDLLVAEPPESRITGFVGTVNTAAFVPEDIVLAASGISSASSFDSVRFRLWIDNITEIDQTFTTFASLNQFFFLAANQPRNFDLGQMSSFGPDLLTLQYQIDVITHTGNSVPALTMSLNLYNEDPALLTPEPASLSLLAFSTLPLLLKRRRKI